MSIEDNFLSHLKVEGFSYRWVYGDQHFLGKTRTYGVAFEISGPVKGLDHKIWSELNQIIICDSDKNWICSAVEIGGACVNKSGTVNFHCKDWDEFLE